MCPLEVHRASMTGDGGRPVRGVGPGIMPPAAPGKCQRPGHDDSQDRRRPKVLLRTPGGALPGLRAVTRTFACQAGALPAGPK